MSAEEPKTTVEATPATAPTTAVEETKPGPIPAEPTPAIIEESKAAPALEPNEPIVPVPEKDEKPAAATEAKKEEAAPAPAVEVPKKDNEPPLPVPEKDVKPAAETPAAPATPLSKLFAELPAIIKEADYKEMWGIQLADESHVPTSIVLEKFLRANNKDVAKSKTQLKEALIWRKKMQPLELLANTEFDKTRFGDLGYVTTYTAKDGKEIITWNIYGTVKDNKATFGNTEEFIKWRCALMELSVKELGLATATTKIPEDGPDPYRMIQVHDYNNVSFLRMDPNVKAASKEIIQTFSVAYPELLKEKFFVNVPLLMGWVFSAMKLFLSAETIKKFHPLSNGKSLAGEVPGFGEQLPEAYGGKGPAVTTGLAVKYAAVPEVREEAKPETKEEAKKEEANGELKKEEVKEEVKNEEAKEEVKKEEQPTEKVKKDEAKDEVK